MSQPVSSLPEAWVERIFATMRAAYGATFDRQWEAPAGSDVAEHSRAIKALWARELGGFIRHPAAISYALENLPEFPPNLPQFKAIAIRAPGSDQAALPAPKNGPIPPAVLERLKPFLDPKPESPLAWAYRLQEREKAGETLTPAQRAAWRDALAGTGVPALPGGFSPIDPAVLPPGMRSETLPFAAQEAA